MIPLTHMTQAAQDVEIKGGVYTLSPLVLADAAKMKQWFMDQPLEEAKEELAKFGKMYDAETRSETIMKAKKLHDERREVISGQDIDPELVAKVKSDMNLAYSSVEGVTRMLWLSIKKTKPDAKLEEVAELVDVDTVLAVQEIITRMMFAPQPEDGVDDEEKKTAGEN
jgi:hypothetical protein